MRGITQVIIVSGGGRVQGLEHSQRLARGEGRGTSTLGPVPGAISSDTIRAGGGPSMGPGAESGALRLANPDSTSRVSWSPTRSGAGSVGSLGCCASRGTGADKSATRLHGMGVVPCTSTRGRGRGMLPSALTTARWEVGVGSCMRVILVREPGGGQHCRVAPDCEFMVKAVGYPDHRGGDSARAILKRRTGVC